MKTQIFPINKLTDEQLAAIVRAIERGAVVALATDTVYGLATNAFDEKAITRIYALKERPAGMPLQILIGSTQAAQQIAQWNQRASRLAKACWPGALTLIVPASEKGKPLLRGAAGLGLRVPNHAGLLHLLETLNIPMACTSANVHGCPVITQATDLIAFADGKVDFILTDGNLSPVASSVLDITAQPTLLREGALSRTQLEKILQEPIK